jgi:hypothetical protein
MRELDIVPAGAISDPHQTLADDHVHAVRASDPSDRNATIPIPPERMRATASLGSTATASFLPDPLSGQEGLRC